MHSLLLIHSSSVTSLTTMKAKVGFVTLHLPLLSLSLRNRPPDMFHLPWLWALLLSAQENPPVCPDSYSSHSRENTDQIFFSALLSWCSIWMAEAVSNMVMVLLGPASQIIYLTHHLYMPAGGGSGCNWSRFQVWHHAHSFQQTQEGSAQEVRRLSSSLFTCGGHFWLKLSLSVAAYWLLSQLQDQYIVSKAHSSKEVRVLTLGQQSKTNSLWSNQSGSYVPKLINMLSDSCALQYDDFKPKLHHLQAPGHGTNGPTTKLHFIKKDDKSASYKRYNAHFK